MIKRLIVAAMAAFTLMACTSQQKTEEVVARKVLVLYYSQTGATKAVAEEIQKQLDADIEAIEVVEPYDGDFQQTIERCQKEMAAGDVPALKNLKVNIADYDTIFLGYPVWFGTYAMPIASLVKTEAFEGKTIVPFCTFGSGGLNATSANLKAALPKAEILNGYGVRNARISSVEAEVTRFLIEQGHKDGEIEALPGFMEQHPVSEEEVEIFNQACGDYQFPLGTPVSVAGRTTATSVDYLYTVSSKNQAGEEQTAYIMVTVSKEEGSKPEFTWVEKS